MAHVWSKLGNFDVGDKVWIKKNKQLASKMREPTELWWITDGISVLNVTEELLRHTVHKDRSVGGKPRIADEDSATYFDSILDKAVKEAMKYRK
jgi:hypothetical protein